ncbi:hypothetical protein ACFSC4_07725 [Deinococcus malanensis]|uniref:hypothetical protein n=1 Tax=Deinococcus malanensis TaxID=1706855 RepID=UPI00363B9D5F
MRIRLDPWPVDMEDGQLGFKDFGGVLIDIETPRWAAIPARPCPSSCARSTWWTASGAWNRACLSRMTRVRPDWALLAHMWSVRYGCAPTGPGRPN